MEPLRSEIRAFLGSSPRAPAAAPTVSDEYREDGYTRKAVSYATSDGEEVAAFLFEPQGGRRPGAVVALHQHNSQWEIGKSEIAGLAGDPYQAFGPALARAGVAVLAPDAVGFESRGVPSTAGVNFAPPVRREHSSAEGWLQYYNQAMHRLACGELLMAKLLSDTASAVSALQSLAGTDRVGLIGHSYGGNVALFAAALDPRVAFACASGAACSYRYKLAHGVGLELALVIPGFAARFDLDDLMRCIAPRRLLVVSSDGDPYSADAGDLVARARPAFEAAGAGAALQHLPAAGPHALDASRFDAIVGWLVNQAA
jgi:dienelactone hydrolase